MAEKPSFPPSAGEIARRRALGEELGKKLLDNKGTVIGKADALLLLDFWVGQSAKDVLRLSGIKAGVEDKDETEA